MKSIISDRHETISLKAPKKEFFLKKRDSRKTDSLYDQSKICIPKDAKNWPIGIHYVEIHSGVQARKLLGPNCNKIRAKRSEVYYRANHGNARNALRLGKHDRGEEYILANGKIYDEDIAGHKRHLPLHVKVIRLDEYHIKKNSTWDITASYTSWKNLHFREELYVYVHINKLIVEPGATLEVHGNVFIMSCDEILVADSPNTSSIENTAIKPVFEIRILGTKHPSFSEVRRFPALHGVHGTNGNNGYDGSNNDHMATPFGSIVIKSNDDMSKKNGQDGENGEDGQDGTHGQNGGLLMVADIRIGKLTNFKPNSFCIFGQAGKGLDGGHGGNGGDGGNGGHGANGFNGLNGLVTGGSAGSGGHGGNGGNGGHGGHGGLSSNIFVQIPSQFTNLLDIVSSDSLGGKGGHGGKDGINGKNGDNGLFNQPNKNKINLCKPKPGIEGKQGHLGRGRKGPNIYVFTEKCL